MFIFKTKKPAAWGLDIGEKKLKLVALVPNGHTLNLTHYNSIDLDGDEIIKNEIADPNKLAKKIKLLVDTAHGSFKLKSQFVHACIPDTQTFVKLIDIPDMTDEEIPEAIKWASEHHIPIPPDEIYLDWQIVHHDPQNKKIKILIAAVTKKISDEYVAVIKLAGLIPLSLDVETTAIIRALRLSILEDQKTDIASGVALIDLGQTHTSLAIIANKTIQFISSIPFAGEKTTKILANKLKLTMEQAEKAKKICGLNNPECEDALKKILSDDLKNIIIKINTAFEFYQNNIDDSVEIKNIIITGGGAYMPGIEEFLEKELKIKVTKGNPGHYVQNSAIKFPPESDLRYATSIGLAIKAYE